MFHRNIRRSRSGSFRLSTSSLATAIVLLATVRASLSAQSASARSAPAHAATGTPCPACTDFYTWANRAWLDTATIPAASSEVGTWSANDARVTAQLHAAMQAAEIPPARASFTNRTLGTMYISCMDSVRANADGVTPLRAELTAIDRMQTPANLAGELARLHRSGVSALFTLSSDVDRAGDLRYAPTLDPQRLPLGAHGYAPSTPSARERLTAYRAHVARVLALAGESPSASASDADAVVAIDSALAAATLPQPDDYGVADMFRRVAVATIERSGSGFDWPAYLEARRAPRADSMITMAPSYFVALAPLVRSRPIGDWRAYLRWRLLATSSPFLSDAFAREDFDWSRASTGATVNTPRWERCVREISADVPEVAGRAYAERNFPPSAKARIDSMVTNIRAVLVERIATVPWLTDATRRATLAKARRFGVKIGYPDEWHDVSALRIAPGPFVNQRVAAQRYEADRMIARIGTAPRRGEWDYHSYYHFIPQSPTAWANWDEIIFPAAYLQAPLYDSTASLANNYGAIGVIIGHEMTHLFTADGGDVDARGAVRHWWTPTDSVRFAVIQQRVVHQFDAYTVLDSATHVNGTLTLSENLADLGGVELAYAAMERELARHPDLRRASGDTTAEQRFFLSYARVRASKMRPERERSALTSDPHAPSQWRANGPLSQFPGFAKAFGCHPGDPMARPDSIRARIWDPR